LLEIGVQYIILMPYNRIHEREADMIGMDLMDKAGFDPRQSIGLWQKMEQESQGQHPREQREIDCPYGGHACTDNPCS